VNRRDFLKVAGLAPGAAASASRLGAPWQSPTAKAARAGLPNFVFLISDDQSVPDLSCYGNRAIHTPNIDQLARDGMRFENGFVTSPSCSPSRSSILTGRYAHSTGTARLHAPMPAYLPTILESLKGLGYFTGAFRKVHLGDAFWKRWDFEGRAKDFATFFDARPTDRPFYLHVGFHDPHRPYWPREFSPAYNPRDVEVPGFLPDTVTVRHDIAHYYDEISRMDRNVGKILALLEEHGLTENTLVIFTSDNGLPFPGAKGTLYDPGLHVPLIARMPGVVTSGKVSSELISLIDLAPTWLEAAGLTVPDMMRGRSFLPLLQGDAYQPREAIFAERNYHTHLDLIRAVRTKRYKLIQNFLPEIPYRPTSDLARSPSWHSIEELQKAHRLTPAMERRFFAKPRPAVELYDLEQDPGETNNLAADPGLAGTLKQLQERLSQWMARTGDFLPPPIENLDEDFRDENAPFDE
jgi:N-sulfoglucosamine sulfohydrolase